MSPTKSALNRKLRFRFADRQDVTSLWHLYKQLIPNMQTTDEDMSRSLNIISTQPNAGGVVVGDLGGNIVSTCQLIIFENLVRAPYRRCVIESIVVDSRYRKQGIGENMLKYVINYARREQCIMFAIMSSTKRKSAHRLFRKLGFKEFGKGFLLDET